MLSHAEVVVGTPHRDVVDGAVGLEVLRRRVATAHTADVGEDAVTAFLFEGLERLGEFL
jgi:hypothetical protein